MKSYWYNVRFKQEDGKWSKKFKKLLDGQQLARLSGVYPNGFTARKILFQPKKR